jgi:Arc/MetJ family transcription regulator
MRTNIEIDDALMAEAMARSGLSTKKATIEEALRQFVSRQRRRKAISELAGLGWNGDLDQLRTDHTIGGQ